MITGKTPKPRKSWWPIEKVTAFAKSEGITSSTLWYKRCKEGLPDGIPLSPKSVYGKEFVSWGVFLGTGTIAPQKRQFLTYDQAKIWAQKQGVTSYNHWLEFCKDGLPEYVPTTPHQVYKEEFEGYSVFLGFKTVAGVSRIERILKFVLQDVFCEPHIKGHQQNILGQKGNVHRVDCALPSVGLIVEYDGCYWHKGKEISDQRKTQSLINATPPWNVIRMRGKPLELLNEKWDLSVNEKLPHHIQVSVLLDHLLEKNKQGLLSLSQTAIEKIKTWTPKRLAATNFREILTFYDSYDSYEEVLKWAQEEGITTSTQWRTRRKQGLPPNIPGHPERVYKQFTTWGDFLGTKRTANQNRQFATYEQASEWAKSEGIASGPEWFKRSKNGDLPLIFPSAPNQVYAQFTTWGDFLGTKRVANQNRQFATYEQASEWAQNNGVNSQRDWSERSKNNTLPDGFPAVPARVYPQFKGAGGWYGFLGKDAKKIVLKKHPIKI